ncbi:hypothetical protein HDU86_007538 [Geranomyces michiganensis]|nr:hypothetical protein HDU86_007538 [Geranomyces michiganensis]
MWAFKHTDAVNDFIIKLMLLGDSQVGKSQMFQRILRKPFSTRYKPTVGIDFGTLTLKIATGRTLRAQIVDTSGLDSYRSITQSYWSLANGAIIAYDITSRDSFNRVRTWVRDFKNKSNKGVEPVIMIVGTKSDQKLAREVPTPEAQAYALAQGFLFMETSAQDNHNVELAFTVLLTDVYYAMSARANKNSAEKLDNQSRWQPQERTSSLWASDSLLSPLSPMTTMTATTTTRPSPNPRHRSFDERLFAMFKWLGNDNPTTTAEITAAGDSTLATTTDMPAGASSAQHHHHPPSFPRGRSPPTAAEQAADAVDEILVPGPIAAALAAASSPLPVSTKVATQQPPQGPARMGRVGNHGYDDYDSSEIEVGAAGATTTRLGRSKTTVVRN